MVSWIQKDQEVGASHENANLAAAGPRAAHQVEQGVGLGVFGPVAKVVARQGDQGVAQCFFFVVADRSASIGPQALAIKKETRDG